MKQKIGQKQEGNKLRLDYYSYTVNRILMYRNGECVAIKVINKEIEEQTPLSQRRPIWDKR